MRIVLGLSVTNWLLSRFGAFDNRMAYLKGLQKLGHEVYLFGDIDSKRCYNRDYEQVPFAQWEGRAELQKLTKAYGVDQQFSLIYNQGEATYGLPFRDVVEIARSSDLLLNINGRLKTPAVIEAIPCKAYIDLDPSKTQVYHAEYGIDQGLDAHDHFFTVGWNIGTSDCEIPSCNRTWYVLPHPVFLPHWPQKFDPNCRRFTTISSWEGKETFNFQGKFSGEKSDRWRSFMELPRRSRQEMELSLKIHPAYQEDIQALQQNGWTLVQPEEILCLEDYRSYIQGSRGEFSIANHRYVQFRTGWFSDRSARYLAAGKPVVVQSTGIEDHLPTGKGLLTFATLEEAVAAIDTVNSNYREHCNAARTIAEEYFDAEKVLRRLLDQVNVGHEDHR